MVILVALACVSCNPKTQTRMNEPEKNLQMIAQKAGEYAPFTLTADLTSLTVRERQMLPLLFEAASLMEEIFWKEAFGDKSLLFEGVTHQELRKFLEINYGPWERLNNNEPFLSSYGPKPKGAQFYPQDMTREEFEAWDEPSKSSLYTLIRRDQAGKLAAVPYHVAFKEETEKAAELIRKAAELADDPGLKKYLNARAEALLTDAYFESDMLWMDMKSNSIEFIVGPIENYEDQLFGYKAAHEAFVLVKDLEWSKKLEKYTALLPGLQQNLPVPPEYKSETPGVDSDMNVYDALYYAGDCNAGSKTIAINLPNDEKVQAAKGSRKLQLKNSMQAKFDKILVPIAELLIDSAQLKHVRFDAFFENTMFHEVAHGLGPSMTLGRPVSVRMALKDAYTSLEESKADILGLWCVHRLNETGEFPGKDMMDNYVTFMAGIFRSVRFGAASAHGKANMIRFNYFKEQGAFEKDSVSGKYRVDYEKMKTAMIALSEMVLRIQGDGNYEEAAALIKEKGIITEELQKDLDRISSAGIPRDIVFNQGPSVLEL